MAAGPPKRGTDCKSCSNRDFCIFSGLAEEGLAQVAQMIRQTPHARGEIIFQQGSPIFGYYILCQGRAKLAQRAISGKKQVFRFYSPGDLVGESILRDVKMHSAYARVLEDSVVYFSYRT